MLIYKYGDIFRTRDRYTFDNISETSMEDKTDIFLIISKCGSCIHSTLVSYGMCICTYVYVYTYVYIRINYFLSIDYIVSDTIKDRECYTYVTKYLNQVSDNIYNFF